MFNFQAKYLNIFLCTTESFSIGFAMDLNEITPKDDEALFAKGLWAICLSKLNNAGSYQLLKALGLFLFIFYFVLPLIDVRDWVLLRIPCGTLALPHFVWKREEEIYKSGFSSSFH